MSRLSETLRLFLSNIRARMSKRTSSPLKIGDYVRVPFGCKQGEFKGFIRYTKTVSEVFIPEESQELLYFVVGRDTRYVQ